MLFWYHSCHELKNSNTSSGERARRLSSVLLLLLILLVVMSSSLLPSDAELEEETLSWAYAKSSV